METIFVYEAAINIDPATERLYLLELRIRQQLLLPRKLVLLYLIHVT
jgi:hypothetical protein